ncbi:hypothetical protein [Rickettsia endosymbiont of Orchestes rusci]|uniref:hypothetical protein n=1 Tax=Rickettsia endosymbiont of Orchestes rusci TaxID=3066250 RepID=UPI00313C1E9D
MLILTFWIPACAGMTPFLWQFLIHATTPVKPRHDTETLCKNSSHATTPRL